MGDPAALEAVLDEHSADLAFAYVDIVGPFHLGGDALIDKEIPNG